MTARENKTDFLDALKAAIFESLMQAQLITKAEKTAFEEKNKSLN